jgi:protease PrsW
VTTTAVEQTAEVPPRTAGRVAIISTMVLISVVGAIGLWQDTFSLALTILGPPWVAISTLAWAVYGLLLLLVLRKPMGGASLQRLAIVLALAWGGLGAVDVIGRANEAVLTMTRYASESADGSWSSFAIAPLLEETMKTLGIVMLALLPAARRFGPAAGLAVGGLVGISFQVMENLVYTLVGMIDAPDQAGAVLLQMGVIRGIVGLFGHVVYSGVIGAALGVLIVSGAGQRARGWAVFVGAFVSMVGLHMLGNWAADQGQALLYLVSMGAGLVVLVLVVRRVHRIDPKQPVA